MMTTMRRRKQACLHLLSGLEVPRRVDDLIEVKNPPSSRPRAKPILASRPLSHPSAFSRLSPLALWAANSFPSNIAQPVVTNSATQHSGKPDASDVACNARSGAR